MNWFKSKSGKDKSFISELASKSWVSNALIEAERAGLHTPGSRDYSRIHRLTGDGFSKHVVDWNKREQLYHDKTYKLDDNAFLKNKIYDVKVKMYKHPSIVGKDGKPLDIWHAENLAEAEAQVSSILDGPGKGKNFATEKGQAKFEKVKGEEGHYIWRHHKGDDKHVYIKSEGGVIPEGSTPDAVRFEAYQKGGAYYKGVTEDGKLNYEIYSDLIRDKKGKVIQGLGLSASDADGAVFHVPEVMDAVANNTGIQLTSMHKPVMVAKLPEGGTLAVKAAARTAHGPLLKYMRENDLHTVIMKSSAKHSGEKPLKTLTYDGKKYDSSFWNNKESKFQSEPAYDISELGYDLSRTKTREGEMFPEINIADIIPQSRGKLDANKIRINLGTKEDIRRATEPPKIVKQIFGILNEHQSPGLMKHIFEKYFEPSIAGDKVLNNEIASFAKGTTDKMPSIDLNKIGAEEAFKIVRYRGSNKNMNKLRKQFQEKLFKLDKEGELNNSFGEDVESGFTPEEWINYLQKNTRILDNGLGDGVVDLFKPTRKYAEKVLIKYIMKRHMNPQWNWGGKGWLAPVMPDMPIKEGTFKADRDFNIKVKLEYTDAKGEKVDTKSKLRDLWNLKKAVIDGDKKVVSKVKKKYGDDYAEKFTKEDIEDALEFINIRVPADSHSGVRVLKFTGFSKQKGVSIHTSGLDNSYLGGADKDSDSVFIYHGFDKKVRDAYKKQHYEWQEGKKADGEYIDSKSKELDKIFLGEEYAKNQNKLEDAKKKYEAGDISRHDFELLNAQLNPFHTKFSKFSSGMRKHVAQGASTGLKGIGYGVSGLNKVKSMIDYLVANNGRLTETVEYKGKNGKPYTKEYDITLKPGFSYNKVLRLGREIANRSADAADYPSQIGYDKFLDLLTREAFNIKINGDMETSPQYRTLTQTKLGNIADHVRYADPNPKVYDSSYSSGKAELNFDSFEFGIDRGNPIDTPFKGFASKIIESIAKKSLHRNNKSKLDNLQNVEDAILSISRAEKTIEGFDKSLVRRLTGMFDLKLGAKYVKESKREYLDAEFNYQENPSASNMNTLSKARNKYLDVLSTEVHKLASREALFSKGVDIVRSAEKNGVDSKTVDVILEHARKEAFKVKDTLFNRWEVDGEAFFSEKFAKKRAKGREVIRRKPDPELFDIELQSLKQRMLTSKAKFGKGKQPLKEIIDIKLLEDYIDLIALSPFRKGFAATNTSPFMSRYVHKRNLKDTLNRFNKTYKNILEFAPEAPVEVKANLKDAKVGDYVKTSDKNILIKVLDKVKKSIKLGDNKVDTNNDLKFITKLVEANKGKVVETAKDGTKLHLTGKMRGNEVEVTYKTTDEKPKTTKYYPNYLDLSKLNISPELQQALKYSKTFGSSTDFYFEKVEPKLNKDYSYDFVNQTEKSAVDFIKESLDYSRPDTMVESKADKAEVVLEQLEKTVIDNLPKTKKVEKTRSIYDKDKFQVYKTVMSAKDIIEVKKLEKHIKSNPELAKHFNDWYANFMYDMTKTWKHVDAMTIADVKAMNRYLEDVNSRFKKGGVPLPSNAFRTSPTYLSEEMAQTEHKFFASFERPLQKRDGSIVRQKVRRYTSTLGAMKDWMHLVHNQENAYIESVEPQLEKLFPFRKNLTGEQIWDINKTVIDLRNGKYTTPEQASKVKEYAGEKFTIDGKEYTFVEVVKQVNDAYTKVFKEAGDVWIYAKNSKGEHVKWNKLDNVVYKNSKIKKGTSVNKYLRFKKDGSLDILNFLRNATDPALKGQKLNKIPIENILRFGYEYRLEKIIKKNIKSNGKLDWGKTELSPLEFRAAWRSNSKTKFKGIGKFKAEEYYPRMNFGFNKEARAKMLEFKTQKVKEAYDDAIAKGKSKKEADEIAKMKMLKFEMINEAGKAQGGGVEKQAVEHLMENLDIKGNLKNLENIGLNNRPPNILERTAENMPGYDTTASVVDSYMKTLIRSHYKLLTSAMANYRIDKFEQEGAFGKHTKDWAQHLKFYIRDSLGHPTTFSEDVLDATAVTKNYRDLLKSSLYYKMSDHRVMEAWDKMEAIANGKPVKMGKDMEIVIKAVMPFSKNLPKVTASKGKEYTFTDTPGLYAEQVKARKEYQSRIIHEFGRVEAKYQLLTLLANTGTATANMFGGTGMTVSQGGLKNFMRVHNQGWLQRHLLKNKEGDYHLELNSGKKVKTKKDLYQWVSEQGVIDSFINEEFNLSLEWRNELKRNGKNAKEFMGKATDLIRNNADVKNETLLELARRYNISEGAIKAGGFFMQATERKLRMDAFLTHALKFRENYGTMAKDLPLNDPSVMEAGLKGIEATQFLYHSAFRPAYMRTALGKVMTRFKLFAFESVRARKELYRKAKYYGFEPNTPGFEKFKDLFILDMMTMALGSAFAYSLFDTALPPPYDWLQETGNWLFGDKRERERAFFSQYPYPIAPLQVVTPPIARIPMSAFSTLINGDWDRFADYQMHTLYPFGRIVRQFDKTFNEPYGTTFGRGMQQFFRLPTDKIGKKIRDGVEDIEGHEIIGEQLEGIG
jgi:hypothetical protein